MNLVSLEEFELVSDGLPGGDDDGCVLVNDDRRLEVGLEVERVLEEHARQHGKAVEVLQGDGVLQQLPTVVIFFRLKK